MPDKSKFIQIVKESEGIIFKITKVYASDSHDQKDLYQDIVYQIWKAFDSFREESKRSTWIYRIALNTSIAHQNKRNKNKTHLIIDEANLKLSEDKEFKNDAKMEIMYDHIRRLGLADRGLILLFLEGHSHEEMARITGYSKSNVGTRIARIKQKLKSQINKT